MHSPSLGAEALELIAADLPDLHFVGRYDADLDGITLYGIIKERFEASIPVIFLTAKIENQEIFRLSKLGARGAILKPFEPMTLLQQIK